LLQKFLIIWLSNLSILIVPDEGHSRNVPIFGAKKPKVPKHEHQKEKKTR
jgi:hypothetical protein